MAGALLRCDYVLDVLLKGKTGRPGVRLLTPVILTEMLPEGPREEVLEHPEWQPTQVIAAAGAMALQTTA